MTSGRLQDDCRLTSGLQKALREHSKSPQTAREQSDFIIPSEPKIFRLVYKRFCLSHLSRPQGQVVVNHVQHGEWHGEHAEQEARQRDVGN